MRAGSIDQSVKTLSAERYAQSELFSVMPSETA